MNFFPITLILKTSFHWCYHLFYSINLFIFYFLFFWCDFLTKCNTIRFLLCAFDGFWDISFKLISVRLCQVCCIQFPYNLLQAILQDLHSCVKAYFGEAAWWTYSLYSKLRGNVLKDQVLCLEHSLNKSERVAGAERKKSGAPESEGQAILTGQAVVRVYASLPSQPLFQWTLHPSLCFFTQHLLPNIRDHRVGFIIIIFKCTRMKAVLSPASVLGLVTHRGNVAEWDHCTSASFTVGYIL